MNEFHHSMYIGDKHYNIYMDSSRDEWKRITVNNKELVNEKYTLAMNFKACCIYYPIVIDGHEIVIEVDDNDDFNHKYQLYMDGVSVFDGTRIDEDCKEAEATLSHGFRTFAKNNYMSVLKDYWRWFIGSLAVMAVMNNYGVREFGVKFLVTFLAVPLLLPLLVAVEWLDKRLFVKRYKNSFRPRRVYKN